MQLEKMLEMNSLFAFYGGLLTARQQEFMRDYYENDFTLQEIADNNQISRQAVSDSLKKAEEALKEIETQVHAVAEFKKRRSKNDQLLEYVKQNYPNDQKLKRFIENLVLDTTNK